MSGPNFCTPCGRYHPRDYQDCERRKPAPAVPRENIEVPVPVASDPTYVAGWRAGYEAAMRDHAEKTAAA